MCVETEISIMVAVILLGVARMDARESSMCRTRLLATQAPRYRVYYNVCYYKWVFFNSVFYYKALPLHEKREGEKKKPEQNQNNTINGIFSEWVPCHVTHLSTTHHDMMCCR